MSNKHSVPDEGPPSLSAQDQKGSGFALPELEHNLQLLIDLTEQDILQVRGNQKYLPKYLWLRVSTSFLCTIQPLLLLPHTCMHSLMLCYFPPPVVRQTSAAWKRCGCVSEPWVTSTAEQTGCRARIHPENGSRFGIGGTFSFWGDGTWGGTHPAGTYAVNTQTNSYSCFSLLVLALLSHRNM